MSKKALLFTPLAKPFARHWPKKSGGIKHLKSLNLSKIDQNNFMAKLIIEMVIIKRQKCFI